MMCNRPGLPLCTAVFAAACLVAGPSRAMVGITTTDTSLAESTVMVLYHQGGTAGFCSGIVLAPDVVLTAAHCVPKDAEVRVHLPGSGASPVMLPVRGIARNPEYRAKAIQQRERSIDLALIRLVKPLPDNFTPATLGRTAGTKLGARFVATGYGVAREGDAPSSGTLRSATLVARAPLSSVLLWAEDPAKAGTGACTGDSGGPVTTEGSRDVDAVLVWSAGAGAQTCGTLTQAVWLAPQKPWIDRVMQAWRPAPQSGATTP